MSLDLERLKNYSQEQIWREEIERRYEFWREVNLNTPVDIKDLAKSAASNFIYLVGGILVLVVLIYLLTLLPSSDCVEADRFGVHQVCGDD
ncbi:hypothetical protein AB4114_29750 [Paenibacillus sp. 2RAB27]|uniref:hypothetical protein n=1 Tax=Paenibacillus sp. 2RAB27 TaxID=3232991 RepID=UPI003F95B72D